MDPKPNPLTWDDALLVGYFGIDEDHKEIFRLLEVLWKAADLDKTRAYEKLIYYVTEHCLAEEAMMMDTLTPQQIAEHRADHYRVQDGLLTLLSPDALGIGEGYRAYVVDYIQDYLIPHIHNYDVLLGKHK